MLEIIPFQELLQGQGVKLFILGLRYAAPFLITLFLASLVSNIWLMYRRARFFAKQTHLLLEIKLPKEIFKSPVAMEFLFNALYQTGGEGTWYDVYWEGKTRPWYSLEICCIDGRIHFYIWTRKAFKNIIEANLYSQYPGVEIYEVPDYTLPVEYDPEKNGMWFAEYELTQPDPYPIKTYIDYGMDKDPKEEYKIDPLSPMLEFLSALGQGQQAWIQIIIRAHKAEDFNPETGKMEDGRWVKASAKIVDEIRAKTKSKEPGVPDRKLSEGEVAKIKALERSITKPGFDVGIRTVYIAEKDVFNQGNSAGIVAGMRNFNSGELNGFKAVRMAVVNYPWQDRSQKERNKKKHEALFAYKNRGYFYNEFAENKYMILNTEELATIFHLPGGVSSNPAIERIGSKKSEAPANIPL